jgi:ApbE superfamily uncharacterized protein (UPF0280 family)
MFAPAIMQELTGGRLHFSHGPIDVVLKAWGELSALRAAYAAAAKRFPTILPELADELAQLRRPLSERPSLSGPVARRMLAACHVFAGPFLTPMAAVAGAVADELLAHMREAAPLERVFVNNGGDIAIWLAPGQTMEVGIAGAFSRGKAPVLNGRLHLAANFGVGGIATSGAQGRSFSLGIADSVTVLANDAAAADAAATLIANAVNIETAAVERRPARELDPDSDLGERLVTVAVGQLTAAEIATALAAGRARAEAYRQQGLIIDAALMLAQHTQMLGGLPLLAGQGLP